jgi:L-rhamnose mutarotase
MDMKADVAKAAITRTMWRKKLDPTKVDEYIDRHENIWPELFAAIKEQGVKNYSIFIDGDECIGYFEHENVAEHARANAVPTQLSIDWEASMRPLSADKISEDQGMHRDLKLVFYVE